MATFKNVTANTLITGTKGNDSIFNGGYRVSISGGAGDDSIYNGADSVTIDGGAGDLLLMAAIPFTTMVPQ